MEVPFVNLKAQYEEIKPEIDAAIYKVVQSQAFIKGEAVDKFEAEWAEYLGVKYVIGVGNGTDALFISLKTLGIGKGQRVWVSKDTFIAAKEAIELCGAEPVYDPMDWEVHACIATHLYGIPETYVLDDRQCLRIPFIEDCSQAHGAEYQGAKVGTFGHIGIFSHFPSKNLGAYGDAGTIVTDNLRYAEYARMYGNHGRKLKHEHKFSGVNSRMDSIQAAVLSVKLKHLDAWNDRRIEVARQYDEQLDDYVLTPVVPEGSKAVYHLYVIETDQRSRLIPYLKNAGIQTGIHYPYLLDGTQNAEILSLPIHGSITDKEVEYVCSKIKSFFK